MCFAIYWYCSALTQKAKSNHNQQMKKNTLEQKTKRKYLTRRHAAVIDFHCIKKCNKTQICFVKVFLPEASTFSVLA